MQIGIYDRSKERGSLARSIRTHATILRVLILVSISTTITLAQTAPSESLQDVRNRIGRLEASLANEEIKFHNARDEITEIERRLHEARREKDKFRQELETKSSRINSLRAERDRLNRAYDATSDALKKTLLARFMLWRQPKLKILLNNTNVTELQRHLTYFDYIATANNQILQDQTGEIDQIHGVEAALKLEASKLRYMRNQAEEPSAELTAALVRRKQIAESLEQLLQENEHALGQLQEDEIQLSKLVDDVTESVLDTSKTSAPFGGLKGALSWPTAGRIAKAPGGAMRAGGAKWSGVIIESEPGSVVAAIADGHIAFADWFRNFGLLVIIDHGDGYMSLYGHNQELYKESGDPVAAGEAVATVGDTGGKSTSGLYFEIRQNGMPQDPRKWCRK